MVCWGMRRSPEPPTTPTRRGLTASRWLPGPAKRTGRRLGRICGGSRERKTPTRRWHSRTGVIGRCATTSGR